MRGTSINDNSKLDKLSFVPDLPLTNKIYTPKLNPHSNINNEEWHTSKNKASYWNTETLFEK